MDNEPRLPSVEWTKKNHNLWHLVQMQCTPVSLLLYCEYSVHLSVCCSVMNGAFQNTHALKVKQEHVIADINVYSPVDTFTNKRRIFLNIRPHNLLTQFVQVFAENVRNVKEKMNEHIK